MLTALFVVLLALAGCGGTQPDKTESPDPGVQPPVEETATNSEGDTLYTPEYVPTGEEVAVFKTSQGEITVRLFGKDAPLHVGNFVELTQRGFYDQTKFHRYEPGFVVQGGDPQTKDLSAEDVAKIASGQMAGPALGTGGPGHVIRGEFDPQSNPNKHTVGALGMARSQDPDSAGSQFYFALRPLPELDGGYTVFGVVTEGMDVVDKLRIGDEIESIEIRGAAQ
jgi:peptidyl-prolyl cis-trans isomerase B (cyclophilin B)